MAIGSADNDIIDCTDIAEFYCWPAFPSRSCPTHTARSTWSATMSIWGIASKITLFLIQYATMRTIGVRRRRAQMALAQS